MMDSEEMPHPEVTPPDSAAAPAAQPEGETLTPESPEGQPALSAEVQAQLDRLDALRSQLDLTQPSPLVLPVRPEEWLGEVAAVLVQLDAQLQMVQEALTASFAEKLKSARAQRRLSQAELAQVAGVSRNMVEKIENRRLEHLPPRSIQVQLAKTLAIPVEDLVPERSQEVILKEGLSTGWGLFTQLLSLTQEAYGLTQRGIARELGVSHTTIRLTADGLPGIAIARLPELASGVEKLVQDKLPQAIWWSRTETQFRFDLKPKIVSRLGEAIRDHREAREESREDLAQRGTHDV
jgi:transcriptional regulator with XRE-family HTH domain